MNNPLVSVICLCHNHKEFVEDAIRSVWQQTYGQIELIVVDDASTDGSREKIREILRDQRVEFIELKENIGNCAAFNIGLQKSKGEYIIDLAADDILLPPRIELGIKDFSHASNKAGVHFSDVFLSDKHGQILSTHYGRNHEGLLQEEVPVGDIYGDLIHKYFISPPSMMIKREVLGKMGGYDENLTYEDFDFWIRSSRHYDYIFNTAPLVKKRLISGSHSFGQRQILNPHQKSTFLVCRKIFDLNRKPQEYKHLISRCYYEISQCLLTLNLNLIPKYFRLIQESQAAYRRLSSSSSIEI